MKKYSIKSISQNDIWQSENIYHLKTDISRISKLIYHYEIFKKISGIPGDIVEMGVFKGISLIRFATYRAILENNFSRTIYGFDDFGEFTPQFGNKDKIFIKRWKEDLKRNSNSDRGISLKELKSILKKKKFKNINLIKGNIIQTLPKFLNKKKIKISLLHLDLDLFEPTIFALEKLYNKVKKGGIILLDDYKIASGVTKAVNKFKKEKKIEVKKIGNLYYFQIYRILFHHQNK